MIIKGKKYKSEHEIHSARYKNNSEYREAYHSLDAEFAIYDAFMKFRIQRKMTQKQLADKLGTHQSSIARFESGHYSPSLEFVQKVAHALGLRLRVSR